MAEMRPERKCKGTGKALLGQQLQLKGDIVRTVVPGWHSGRQPRTVRVILLQRLRGEGVMHKHIEGVESRKVGAQVQGAHLFFFFF